MVGHYQALLPPNKNYKEINIVDLISILRDSESILTTSKRIHHIYPTGEPEDDSWAVGYFSDAPSLFPLMPYGQIGFILSFKGKTYHLSYDENDMLTMGIGVDLFSIENPDFIADCTSLYDIIWEDNVALLFDS